MVVESRPRVFLVIWFGTNLLFGAFARTLGLSDMPVAWIAHVGGFVAGHPDLSAVRPAGGARGGLRPMPETGRAWNRRLVAIAAILMALTAVYVLALRQFRVAETPREQSFGAAAPIGEILIRPLSVDALNRVMQVAVYLSPRLAEGKAPPLRPNGT